MIAAGGAAGTAAVHYGKKEKVLHTNGKGRTVLITGASGGIGLELACIFVQHHFSLVLTARGGRKN